MRQMPPGRPSRTPHTEQPALDWSSLETGEADACDGLQVTLSGWLTGLDAAGPVDYGLLTPQAPCCGQATGQANAAVEVYLRAPLASAACQVTLSGRWLRLTDDPCGWRYQLRDAIVRAAQDADDAGLAAALPAVGRRLFLGAGAAFGLVACSTGPFTPYAEPVAAAPSEPPATTAWLAENLTIDIHSHAGRAILARQPAAAARPFTPVAEPMREGGMQVICLAVVADTPTTQVSPDRRRFEAYRSPAPGELYAHAQAAFARAAELVRQQALTVVTDARSLRAVRPGAPAVIVACEGADFLEGHIDRVDEMHRLHGLRHLQLTHYRVNELGDIQTEPPVHGGLTDFGAEVVQRCNALGIVVDVAHGTFDLVQRAAAVSRKPLVLSHTSLATRPGPRSRLITPAHARLVAATGGVIGVWPSAAAFTDLAAMAAGARRMADVVGVDHVALGTDMLGFITTPVFTSYRQLPLYAEALLTAGFNRGDVAKVLGGNYLRVFEATLAA